MSSKILPNKTPAIVRPVEGSVTPQGIYCLFDGNRRTILKHYLDTKYRMTPEQYREVCGLPEDYPMVAPEYAAEKAKLAGMAA